jgi:hypothetical protein
MRGSPVAAVSLCALLLALPAGASNSATYADSTGEDPAGPDITSVVVSNDDTGLITFQVNISNRPAMTPDMGVLIYLDTDDNRATGDPQAYGAEYVIELDPGFVDLFQWQGSNYGNSAAQAPSLVYSYGSAGATIKIKASDLGGSKLLNFVAAALSGLAVDANGNPNYANVHVDFAPDPGHGAFTYQVMTTLKLAITSFTTTPATVRAGGTLSASAGVTENDTNGPVQQGFASCHATVAGKVLTVTANSVVNGVASCAWKVPKTAKGKKVSATLTVVDNGAKVSRSFSAKVH